MYRDMEIVDSISLLVRGNANFSGGGADGGLDENADNKSIFSLFRLQVQRSERKSVDKQSIMPNKMSNQMEARLLSVGTCFGIRMNRFSDPEALRARTIETQGPLDQWRGTVVACEDCILLSLSGRKIRSLAMKFGADFTPIFDVLSQRINQTIVTIARANLAEGLFRIWAVRFSPPSFFR